MRTLRMGFRACLMPAICSLLLGCATVENVQTNFLNIRDENGQPLPGVTLAVAFKAISTPYSIANSDDSGIIEITPKIREAMSGLGNDVSWMSLWKEGYKAVQWRDKESMPRQVILGKDNRNE